MKKFNNILKLIRVKHYIKNLLIFAPLLFVHKLFTNDFFIALIGFLSFCFMASVVYIINDIYDLEEDKLNELKKKRVLASGKISKKEAIIITTLLLVLSITIYYIFDFNYQALILLFIYLVLNILYTLKLKTIPIIDIFLLVSFYIIRIYYGAILIDVNISYWLYLTAMSLSFYLALGKRRNELDFEKHVRKVLKTYNRDFLNKFMNLTLTSAFIFYSLWTIEQNIKFLPLTVPLVLSIIMKYSLNIEKNVDADPTEVLFKDNFLILLCLIYGCVIIYIMR